MTQRGPASAGLPAQSRSESAAVASDPTVSRYYTQAVVVGRDQDWLDGTRDRLINVKFRTLDVSEAGESEGETEWVTFTLHGLEHLSMQLAAAVETVRRWTPGEDPQVLGSNLGMTAQNVKE